MKIKISFAAAQLLLLAFGLYAQSPVQFKEIKHNFGEIAEAGGEADYKFVFINNGKEAVVINNVQASCGCTTPDWSKDAIMPGKEGFVLARYNPKGRPGPFIKTLTVFTDKNEQQLLTIEGNVVPGSTVKFKPREYKQQFLYNQKTVVAGDAEFQKFVTTLLPVIEKNGGITVSIESSASHVPTKTFANNEDLSRKRAAEAREKLLLALKQKGVDTGKVKFNADKSVVQGPEYENDFEENRKVYEEFQYIKIVAE
jgi:hypothetical protein